VKSTLRSVNSILIEVSQNEKILSEGLQKMVSHINARDGEVKRMFTASSIMLTVNEHTMQLGKAINECIRKYEILINAIINFQKGILQPHINPAQIMKQMKLSQADIPSELSLLIPLSATYQNLVLRLIEFDLFIKSNFLVYAIRLPLINHVVYNVYHVLPL
jgi:hypothetical protein